MAEIADVLPSALSALVHAHSARAVSIPDSDAVVVVLIDGMGAMNLQQAQEWGIDMRWLLDSAPIESAFPSTTPVSLASFGTGLAPGQHGFVGATFLIPEMDEFLQPLKWQDTPNALQVQPEPTLFETASRAGLKVTRIGPGAYANSGLTRAVLRGGEHVAADSLDELSRAIATALAQSRQLVYAYYPTLDKVGHVFGVDSDEWRAEMSAVAQFLHRLADTLGPRQSLCVTADHGMLDIKERVWIEDLPSVMRDVRFITGEPRMRHVFAQPGYETSLHRAWQSLEAHAEIFTRDEFVATKLLGPVHPEIEQRIGDVVAISRDQSILASRTVDERVSNLIGNHGGRSQTERLIPCAVMAG